MTRYLNFGGNNKKPSYSDLKVDVSRQNENSMSCLFLSPRTPPSVRIQASATATPPSPATPPPSVVVTRERGKNAKLIHALAKHEINCLELPLIQHKCLPDMTKVSSLLSETAFEWIVITSPEAGQVFLDAWEVAGTPNVKVGVVGAGTASVFDEVPPSFKQYIDIGFAPSKATGKVLASELPKNGSIRCRVLYPASAKAGHDIEEGLSRRGFEVTRLNTYTTAPVQDLDQHILKQAHSVPVVSVASPSAIRAWVHLLPESERWTNSVACIGETTALAAKRLGLKNVYYPNNPGLEGWVDSILEALEVHKKVKV